MVTLAGNNFSKEDAYYAIKNGKILTLTYANSIFVIIFLFVLLKKYKK